MAVKRGFARHFLASQSKSFVNRPDNPRSRVIERHKALRAERKAKELAAAEKVAAKLRKLKLKLTLSTDKDGNVAGSITASAIAQAIADEAKVEIDRHQIELDRPITSTGDFELSVKLEHDVTANIKLTVTLDEEAASRHAVSGRQSSQATVKHSGDGVVASCVYGLGGAGKSYTALKLIESLKAGLPVEELEDLRKSLDLPMERLVPMLGISKATLHRRKNSGRLDPAESDRVVRFARLLGRAAEVLESIEDARRWLNAPQLGLGRAVPLEYAETEVGAREVENLLGRIEYGVYS